MIAAMLTIRQIRDRNETETFKTTSRDSRKTETTFLVLNIDVLMKFSYVTTELPQINKTPSHNCFMIILLSTDDF